MLKTTERVDFSCHKLSDFFESINEFEWANIYLRYLNQIKTAEGEKELAERVLLAEKEKKMDLERWYQKINYCTRAT